MMVSTFFPREFKKGPKIVEGGLQQRPRLVSNSAISTHCCSETGATFFPGGGFVLIYVFCRCFSLTRISLGCLFCPVLNCCVEWWDDCQQAQKMLIVIFSPTSNKYYASATIMLKC